MLANPVKLLFRNLLYVLAMEKLLWLTTTFVIYEKSSILTLSRTVSAYISILMELLD